MESQSHTEKGAPVSHLLTFKHEVRGRVVQVGIQPGKPERLPNGRILTTYYMDDAISGKLLGNISGYLSTEGDKKVFDTQHYANYTIFVDSPSRVHVVDRTAANPHYIPGLVPAAVQQLFQSGVISVWYSSDKRIISDDAIYMYTHTLPELGFHIVETERDTVDELGDTKRVPVYEITSKGQTA